MATLASRKNKINTVSEDTAQELLRLPNQVFDVILKNWKRGIDLIWESEDPQEVFNALGSDAALLVEDSTATIHFLESRVKGCTTSHLSKVMPFTINADGTVTVQ